MADVINIKLASIYCYNEGDGAGDAEPYLWVIFFKIDDDTIQRPEKAELRSTPGNHGNLNASNVVTGMTVLIPSVLGEFQTTVKPLAGGSAIVGCLVIMLEEDNTPNSAIALGKDRLFRVFQLELSKKIQEKIQQGVSGTELTEAEIDSLKQKIATEVEQTIRANVGPGNFIIGFGDMDDIIGAKVFTFTTKQIKENGNALHFSQRVFVLLFPYPNLRILCHL